MFVCVYIHTELDNGYNYKFAERILSQINKRESGEFTQKEHYHNPGK